MTTDTQPDTNRTAIEVAYAALMEVGRRDLANNISGHDENDGHGFYIEVFDDEINDADWAIIDKAETLAREAIGLAPFGRSAA